MAQSPLNYTTQSVDSEEEGQSPTTNGRWLIERKISSKMAQIVRPLCVLALLIIALFTNYKVIAEPTLFYLTCLVSVTINSLINSINHYIKTWEWVKTRNGTEVVKPRKIILFYMDGITKPMGCL